MPRWLDVLPDTFINAGDGTLSSVTVEDYRQWAHSDIIGITNRGALAEFIVRTGEFDGVPCMPANGN